MMVLHMWYVSSVWHISEEVPLILLMCFEMRGPVLHTNLPINNFIYHVSTKLLHISFISCYITSTWLIWENLTIQYLSFHICPDMKIIYFLTPYFEEYQYGFNTIAVFQFVSMQNSCVRTSPDYKIQSETAKWCVYGVFFPTFDSR